ncbi:conserved hypothetical protein [Cupriavidus taiwanensis]|nr:conserved hypothetical protein [Cupriavidus taiwanensis]SPC24895.1 conserved hypothetical protein [Cupriavidus taiwanensis]
MRHDANLSARSEAISHARSSIRGLRARHRREPETRSCPGSQQFAARHPQVGQCEQGHELRGVLPQPSIADLGVAELPLDDPERMLDLGPDARLDSLDLIDERAKWFALVQDATFAWLHRYVPVHARPRVRTLLHALIARIAERVGFLSMQQAVALNHVVDLARRAPHRVHQPAFGVHANVRFHAEIPLVSFLALVHLWVAFARPILGRTRCADQCRVHHRARAQHQSLVAKDVVDQREDLSGQLVLLQQVTEPQDGALVGQPHRPVVQPGELPIQRHVVQRFFHRRVRQAEPLLKEVDAQHCLDRERGTAALAFRGVRSDQHHQIGPWHHTVHLVQEFALAGALGRQVQSKVSLFHAPHARWLDDSLQAHPPANCAEHP